LDFQKLSALKRIPYRATIVTDAIKVKNQSTAFAGGLELVSGRHGSLRS
jgi:hypothetical protein